MSRNEFNLPLEVETAEAALHSFLVFPLPWASSSIWIQNLWIFSFKLFWGISNHQSASSLVRIKTGIIRTTTTCHAKSQELGSYQSRCAYSTFEHQRDSRWSNNVSWRAIKIMTSIEPTSFGIIIKKSMHLQTNILIFQRTDLFINDVPT